MKKIRFAQNLKVLRKKNGLLQREFSPKIYTTVESVCKWERGRSLPRLDLLVIVAEFFNVSLDDLVFGHFD